MDPHPSTRLSHALALVVGLVALALACTRAPESRPVPDGAPRLVLFVVVDQMRADYLDRFEPLLDGGLRRLLDEGTAFLEAHHSHAMTATAPGHATLGTGTFPSHHGIVGNSWFDRASAEEVYAVSDPDVGRSPRWLLQPTLGDRMKEAWPAARVFSVGGKDRSNILLAGKNADAAFWYDRSDGTFTTSPYYAAYQPAPDAPESEETWIDRFEERRLLDPLFGETWSSRTSLEDLAPFGVEPLDLGIYTSGFPYALGGLSAQPDESFYASIYGTPFLDEYVVSFAKALIDGESLGRDDVPDFLGVTLSALDAVGHTYGPDSPEVADTLLNVDRVLADLLDFVDQRIGLDRVVVILSSDHGVGRVPEVLEAHGLDGARFGTAQIECIQRIGLDLTRRFGLEDVEWMPSLLVLDRAVLSERQVDADQVLTTLAERIVECPRIDAAYRPEELTSDGDDLLGLLGRSFHPERSPDLVLLLHENTLTTRSLAASHGSPYRYDTHVPWLVRLDGAPPHTVELPVRTVDVAATLADLLGLSTDGMDGQSRLQLVRQAPTPASDGTTP